jgi:hypothetical protein
MAFPEPASERSRQILQVIWDLSLDQRRKQAAWPTLAALLAALRLQEAVAENQPQSPGTVLRAEEAEALLAQMPRGLINGLGLGVHGELGADKELSLTVAGIAACRDTEETLTLFLRFVQHLVGQEKMLWGDGSFSRDQTELGTSFKLFRAYNARDSSAMPRRPLSRTGIVPQLYLILASEPMPWVDLSKYYQGNWWVKFDRRIRYFKNIRNLNDYWESRFKPWEFPGQVPYPAVTVCPVPDQVSRPGILRGNPDLLADLLLARIFDCCGESSGRVSCPRIDPDVGSAHIRDAVRRLEVRGLIRTSIAITAGISAPHAQRGVLKVMLTGNGIKRASELRSGWTDHVLRDRAARDAVLSWSYDQRIHPGKATKANWIFGDLRGFYSGQFFAKDDILGAVRYLRAKNLIEESTANLENHFPVFPRITVSGIDCVEQGDGVAEYVKQPARTSITYTFNAPVSGTNVAIGGSATQHATVHSMEADNLRILIDAIAQALPGLGLNTQLIGETKGAVNAAAAEAGQPHPDRTRLHAALGKIRDLLARAGNQALAAVLSAAIDYECNKLGIPPA